MARSVLASTYANDPVTGYRDSGDNNQSASGISNNKPGIAIYDRKTLGGWYRVTAPNGRTAVVQHTDIGPAPWTGAQLDVNAVAARTLFHYPQGNAFPTKQGRWRIEYLGKRRPADTAATLVARRAAPKAQAQAAPVQSGARTDLLRSYLSQRGNPNALLALAAGMKSA